MEKVFFSKENFNIIYNILKDKLKNKLNFDISTDQKFHKELINIIKAVYQQRNTFNFPSNISSLDASRYLSQKSINVALSYFTDTINKMNNSINVDQLERDIKSVGLNQTNKIDTRPLSTTLQHTHTNGTSNVMSNFNRLVSQRDEVTEQIPKPINFKEPNNISNNDIKNKYELLQQTRQNEYDNMTQSSQSNGVNGVNNMSNTNSNMNMDMNMNMNMNMNNQPQNTMSHPSTAKTNEIQNNTMMTQQNYMGNPSSNQVQSLLRQQQELQNQINQIQMKSVKQPDSQQVNMHSQINNNIEANKFNPPTQKNIQFLSEDNKPLNDILENQFTSLIDEDDSDKPNLEINEINSGAIDMQPDNNVDYNQILNEMNVSGDVSSQFTNNLQNMNTQTEVDKSVSQIFPNKLIDNSVQPKDTSTVSNNTIPDHELQVIKSSIESHSTNLDNTNNKIDSVIKMMESNDISKFYNTILDIPKMISEQKEKPLTLRTHNLIISSRDRDLSNDNFDKYQFRIVFGAEGSQTTQKIDTSNSVNSDPSGIKEKTFTSSGLRNPTVQQVLKNVVSIKLKRVIIPKPREEFYVPEPYFFLSVDEFGSNIISTKTFTDKIFCKIHFDKEFGFDNGRKYLYYKNDDDDFTMFYSSPLAKLDRLTLKLLDSDGDNARSSFNDTDITQVSEFDNTTKSEVTKDFYANTFIRDRIFNITKNQKTKIKSTNHDEKNNEDDTDDVYSVDTDLSSEKDDKLVNLSNQLEYVFEIKTQEMDPTSQLRPTMS